MTRFTCLILLLLAGCATSDVPAKPLCVPANIKKRIQNPELTWPLFKECFECLHFAHAHKLLEPGSLAYEVFYAGFASYKTLRGIVTLSEQHGKPVKTAAGMKITVCNKTYGFTEEIELVSRFRGRMWTIRLRQEQVDRLKNYAMSYWDGQYEKDGDYYVYPDDIQPTPKWASCPHGR